MCGYLVLGEGEVCKHCGALLPRVSALVTIGGPPPPAPAPPYAPAPARVMAPAPEAPLPPSASFSAPPPMGRDPWDPPSPVPVKTSRSNTPRALIAFIAVTSMVLGWVGMGQFFEHDKLPAGTKAFVAGHGVSFSSPDHTFDAQFPSQPKLIQKQFSVASSAVTLNLAQAQTDDYEVVAASMVVPVSMPDSEVDAAIDQILDAGAASQDTHILTRKKVTIQGASGIEVRAKIKDGYDARLLVVVSGSRFYLLGVHATVGTGRLYDALVSSLIIY